MPKTVHRSARVGIRATPAQRRRLLGLMVSAGDVWAWVIDCNRALLSWRCPPVVNFFALCRELTGVVFGELARICAEDVLKQYSAAWIEAAKRRTAGEQAGFPRRKRRLFPVRFRLGSFVCDDRRIKLATSKASLPLVVRLARQVPFPSNTIRSVSLIYDAGKLYFEFTATVAVEDHQLDHRLVAGIDVGIIHPVAVAVGDEALVISGRALRAEERMHLSDTKRRNAKMGRKAPRRGQRGSRRWNKLRRSQRRAEAKHGRKIRQAHHQAAKAAIAWLVERKAGTVVVGDLKGIAGKDVGAQQNLRLRQWRRTHLMQSLSDKAEKAGIELKLVDERGTSSTCPECANPASKPKGRKFICNSCGYRGHRDVAGARNIAAKGGGVTSTTVLVEHRRAGSPPARRDRRRHLFDTDRSCLAPGRPGDDPGSRSLEGPDPQARAA